MSGDVAWLWVWHVGAIMNFLKGAYRVEVMVVDSWASFCSVITLRCLQRSGGVWFCLQESCSDGPFMAVDFRVRNMSTNFYAVGLDMLANYLFVFSYCQVLPQIKFILSNLVQTLVLDFKLKSNDQF